jgi:hypothetical protein
LPESVFNASLRICGNCLYRTLLDSTTAHELSSNTFVATGSTKDTLCFIHITSLVLYFPVYIKRHSRHVDP